MTLNIVLRGCAVSRVPARNIPELHAKSFMKAPSKNRIRVVHYWRTGSREQQPGSTTTSSFYLKRLRTPSFVKTPRTWNSSGCQTSFPFLTCRCGSNISQDTGEFWNGPPLGSTPGPTQPKNTKLRRRHFTLAFRPIRMSKPPCCQEKSSNAYRQLLRGGHSLREECGPLVRTRSDILS